MVEFDEPAQKESFWSQPGSGLGSYPLPNPQTHCGEYSGGNNGTGARSTNSTFQIWIIYEPCLSPNASAGKFSVALQAFSRVELYSSHSILQILSSGMAVVL
jgi:hypothetical protein